MGAHLQTLKRFRVTTELSGERVLADGQKLQHSASATMDVVRPDRLRATMRSPRSERVLFFDGKAATVAVTSAIVGSIVNAPPPGCMPVNYGGYICQQCGNTWYQPQGAQYVVIAPPY